MHVLIIPSWYPATPDDVDGIFFRLQAQALQRAGHQVGVVAPIFHSFRTRASSLFSKDYGYAHYTEANVPTYVYKTMYFFPRVPYLDRNRWMRIGWKLFERYVRDHGMPDIIHVHSMNHAGILALQIHEKTGIPYVITEHSTTYARNLIPDWQRPSMQKAAEQSSARLAVSRDFCTLLEKEYNGLSWEYVPNILTDRFEKPLDLAAKPVNQDFTFCSVAHLHHKKGFDILLPAFAEALKIHPNLKLKIGGTGLEESKLHAMSKQLGLENSVTFLGGLKSQEVLELMYASDAFVLASRIETFGVVFIEALSQGLPVVATKCGGPETIVNESNGLLAETENIESLKNALVSLYENRNKYSPETLRNNCLAEFGENAVISRLINEYRHVISQYTHAGK